jgi:hypothetical protein
VTDRSSNTSRFDRFSTKIGGQPQNSVTDSRQAGEAGKSAPSPSPKTTESVTDNKTARTPVAEGSRGSLGQRMSERRNSTLGGTPRSSTERSGTGLNGSDQSRQATGPVRDRQQVTPRGTDNSRTTTRSTERSTSGLGSRFQSNRDRATAEKNRQAGTVDVKPQGPTAPGNEVRIRERADGARTRTDPGARLGGRRIETTTRPIEGRAATAIQQQAQQTEARRRTLGSRIDSHLNRTGSVPQTSVRDTHSDRYIAGIHTDRVGARSSYLHARYYDRPDLIRHSDRHMHMYYDSYHHLHHRVIWPSYYYPVCYPYGSYFSFHYVWPYYHRQYVWVSLGGWWPYDYSYMRYYWYGYHPYTWYGYYPVPYEVGGDSDTYNYYTYNYYTSDGSVVAQSEQPVDQSTWSDVQQKLAQQQTQPAPQTLADTRFEEGVKSFGAGNFEAAAEKFAEAMSLSPDDMILPYAYAQALFADGHYSKAADVLRAALQKVTPDKEGVFYPRGLYANDDVLYAQIEKLVDKADLNDNDTDLQLLLGYNLLGVGETGYAREPLERASQDPKNGESAKILLNVLEKMEAKAGAALKSNAAPAAPGADVQGPAQAEPEAVPETPAAEALPLSNRLAPAEQAAPVGPAEKPSNADKQEDNATTPDQSGTGGVQNVVPPAGSGDNSGTPPAPQGNTGSGGVVSTGLETGGSNVPLRLDSHSAAGFAGLGFMALLGCTAVGVQFRHLNDRRVC